MSSLTLIEKVDGRHSLYKCECGTTKVIDHYSVRKGGTRSCGCLARAQLVARNIKNGRGRKAKPEYNVYIDMKRRCYASHRQNYIRYGGRGITVCDFWLEDFDNFYSDMGPRPTNQHSIDRIDNDGPYSSENCRWATRWEQENNKSTNVKLTWKDMTLTVAQWARTLEVETAFLYWRVYLGFDVERILFEPREGSRVHG